MTSPRLPSRCLQRRAAADHQRGFALVVSVIFLAILTALGINAMRNSAMEERMAANTQQQSFSFQSAETGLTVGFSSAAAATTSDTRASSKRSFLIVDGAYCDPAATPGCDSGANNANSATLTTSVWYKVEGKVPPEGHSLDGPFATHHFSMSSDARHGTTRTELLQGFRRLGPSGDQ